MRKLLYINLNPKKKNQPATMHAKKRVRASFDNIIPFVLPGSEPVENLLHNSSKKAKRNGQ